MEPPISSEKVAVRGHLIGEGQKVLARTAAHPPGGIGDAQRDDEIWRVAFSSVA